MRLKKPQVMHLGYEAKELEADDTPVVTLCEIKITGPSWDRYFAVKRHETFEVYSFYAHLFECELCISCHLVHTANLTNSP